MHPITALKHERGHMALKLKGVLANLGVQQLEWARAIAQQSGKPLSQTACTLLLNYNVWPKLTPADEICRQTAAFLRGRGVPEEAIALAWTVENGDPYRHTRLTRSKRFAAAHPQPDPHAVEPLEREMLTAHAKKHFSLFRDPFVNDVVEASDIFLSADQRYVREAMYTTAKHGGFLAVVGESGSGKTTLRRDMLERIKHEPITVIQPRLIDKAKLTAESICDAIIADISQQAPRRTREAKARQVETLLTGSSRAGNNHALVIEEAHDLSIQTLKYLKRFWELEDGFKKLLAIILIGQPELKAKLDERQNYEAREVIRRCEVAELLPLDAHLEDYLALKFQRVGKELQDVLAKDAFDGVRARLTRRSPSGEHSVSMLYPLVVNNLVTKAMNLAAEIGAPKVAADVIKEL